MGFIVYLRVFSIFLRDDSSILILAFRRELDISSLWLTFPERDRIIRARAYHGFMALK